jgi:hypothetical protein
MRRTLWIPAFLLLGCSILLRIFEIETGGLWPSVILASLVVLALGTVPPLSRVRLLYGYVALLLISLGILATYRQETVVESHFYDLKVERSQK